MARSGPVLCAWLVAAIALVQLAVVTTTPAAALFQDQAGLLDWRRDGLGALKAGLAHSKRVFWAGDGDGEAGVLAALQSKGGALEWRRVLPEGEGGVGAVSLMRPRLLATVSGDGLTARLFNYDGHALWETSLRQQSGAE